MTLQEIQYKAQGIIHKWRDDDSAPYIEFVEELAHMIVPEPSEDLEEAADNHIREVADAVKRRGWELEAQDITNAFIAGAKWQADHTPLPEDTVLFYKGVEEGKRLMMEEMSECFVQLKQVQSESINISAVREQLAYNRGASDERYKMRKKMMEDAVEGEVYKFGEVAYVKECNNAELTKYLSQFNNGDKVKIIVIHETDIR